jgi:hypothetical protein
MLPVDEIGLEVPSKKVPLSQPRNEIAIGLLSLASKVTVRDVFAGGGFLLG